jgi:hypothetical protein
MTAIRCMDGNVREFDSARRISEPVGGKVNSSLTSLRRAEPATAISPTFMATTLTLMVGSVIIIGATLLALEKSGIVPGSQPAVTYSQSAK